MRWILEKYWIDNNIDIMKSNSKFLTLDSDLLTYVPLMCSTRWPSNKYLTSPSMSSISVFDSQNLAENKHKFGSGKHISRVFPNGRRLHINRMNVSMHLLCILGMYNWTTINRNIGTDLEKINGTNFFLR